MNEREKPDLSKIEPIGRPPDADDEPTTQANVDRVGGAAAAITDTPPAVGVDPEVTGRGSEPRTSRETEQEMEKLRRG